MALNAEFKAKWIAALRSGEYKQCKGRLCDGIGYCCLGVAEVLLGQVPDQSLSGCFSKAFLTGPDEALGETARQKLVTMNDSGKSFSEIADYIEARL